MPGFDRTGPMGQGPRTGGGLGHCGPSAGAGSFGGFRRNRRNWRSYCGGFGYGRRPRYWGQGYYSGVYPPTSRKEERDDLMGHIANLKADIAAMEDRLAALDADMTDRSEPE